ncbi:hypothetical protein [Massilia sp. Root335]|uniref:hypothetical protein n=1 Tax=Massilia sp. Root335 TaxID=1736517 RepID=UPI0006F82B8F|nr:hypothetical protein [Massilia sp. Root335]KQV52366.1 hypothetical protein ASC93_07120 [Massilia sp. Root335]
MTSTSRTGSKPPSPPEKTDKTKDKSKDKDKDKDKADQDALDQAIGTLGIMMLQKVLQGAKRRRAEMNEDDPDAF